MIISCHQPNYLPHLGFFNKMKQSDVFVIYDTVQFSDSFYVHRNRLRTKNGWSWLTVPVERHMHPISTIKIRSDAKIGKLPWPEYHWTRIEQEYGKTPCFEEFKDEFEKLYKNNPHEKLADFNSELILLLAKLAGIKTKIVRLSELETLIDSDNASERLALVAETLGGTTYLSGPSGGSQYELNEDDFTKREIKIAHQSFEHPVYEQYHARFDKKFEKNLPAIDMLFNTGKILV
jgi:hypothetical protein